LVEIFLATSMSLLQLFETLMYIKYPTPLSFMLVDKVSPQKILLEFSKCYSIFFYYNLQNVLEMLITTYIIYRVTIDWFWKSNMINY